MQKSPEGKYIMKQFGIRDNGAPVGAEISWSGWFISCIIK